MCVEAESCKLFVRVVYVRVKFISELASYTASMWKLFSRKKKRSPADESVADLRERFRLETVSKLSSLSHFLSVWCGFVYVLEDIAR